MDAESSIVAISDGGSPRMLMIKSGGARHRRTSMSPLREGWVTGSATAVGAFIPVFPFLVWQGETAIVVSFVVSMFSHWVVGAARSVFTGRGVFRSGLDMFVVGLGVAIVGYFVGERISGWLS